MAEGVVEEVVGLNRGVAVEVVRRLLKLWGSKRSFIQIAPIKQQAYVTYIIYRLT